MISVGILSLTFSLGACNKAPQETFEEALAKEIEKRVASGELAYADDEPVISTEGEALEEVEVYERYSDGIEAVDVHGNPVEIDGVKVVQTDYELYYKLGEYYPSGEYVAVTNSGEDSGYYNVTIKPNEIIVTNSSPKYYEVFDTKDGEYITYSECKIYPSDQAPEVEKMADGAYPPGRYKVGVQIPAGEYVFKGNRAYAEVLANLYEESDSKIGAVLSSKCAIATLEEGQYVQTDNPFYPVEETANLKAEDGVYRDGMYKVGFHMPAGTYAFTAEVDNGYIEIYGDSMVDSKMLDYIKAEPTTTFTVTDGQYVNLIAGKAVMQ